MEQKCVGKKFQKILENSTNIRSESYWHQINRLNAWRLVTKGQVQKKYCLAVAGITDKLWTNVTDFFDKCVEKKFQKILENSTDIRSESYWHQINRLGAWRLVTKEQVQKKYGLAVAGITDELQTNVMDGAKMCGKQISKTSRKFYRYPI